MEAVIHQIAIVVMTGTVLNITLLSHQKQVALIIHSWQIMVHHNDANSFNLHDI